jgi:mono/diheme cytochrome c family protein
MANQPAYRPLQPSSFFPDGRASRPLVPGTVPRQFGREPASFYTGKTPDADEQAQRLEALKALPQVFRGLTPERGTEWWYSEFPDSFPIDEAVLKRGQLNFNVFCAVCHDRAGTGGGMIPQRGFTQPPSFHIARLRTARPGYFFHVATQGYGAMPSYAQQIPPRERWEIVAYVRALQLLGERAGWDAGTGKEGAKK